MVDPLSRMRRDDLMSKKEVAARTGLGWRQANHLMRDLGLKRIGARKYILATELEAYLANASVPEASVPDRAPSVARPRPHPTPPGSRRSDESPR